LDVKEKEKMSVWSQKISVTYLLKKK